VGVVSPERTRTEPEHAPEPPAGPPPQRERPRFPWGLVAFGLALVAILVGVDRVRDFLPGFDNPFASETIDRSQPAVLQSIQDIGEYRAVSGNFQVILDVHEDTDLPDEILGTRTLAVAVGTVDAGVDLSALDDDAVRVSDDRRSVTITLPPARLYEADLDLRRSYVVDREEGVLNRFAGLFGDNLDYQQELNRLGERKLTEAAQQGSGLVPNAEENTRELLESLLGSLGFTTVVVEFE
jgi:hypothetical protein